MKTDPNKDLELDQETLEVLKYFPDLEKDIKKAEKEYKKGETFSLEEILAELGDDYKKN